MSVPECKCPGRPPTRDAPPGTMGASAFRRCTACGGTVRPIALRVKPDAADHPIRIPKDPYLVEPEDPPVA